MSYTFLQGPEAVSSAASFSDIPAYVLSRLSLTAEKSCCNGNATESCQSSQSGTMCEPLTENRGAEKSMLCAEGSRVLISHAPEQGREFPGPHQGCGLKCGESLGKFDHDTSSLRTHQCSLFGGGVRVITDLAQMGYMGNAGVMGPDLCGADHHRARMWLAAHSDVCGCEERGRETKPIRLEPTRQGNYREAAKRPLLGMDDGLAHWVDRLKAIGNGQVPAVVKLAWETLT